MDAKIEEFNMFAVKMKEMQLKSIALEDDLLDNKRKRDQLEEKLQRLEEEKKVLSLGQKMAQNEVKCLQEVALDREKSEQEKIVKQLEENMVEREKYVQLKEEVNVLEMSRLGTQLELECLKQVYNEFTAEVINKFKCLEEEKMTVCDTLKMVQEKNKFLMGEMNDREIKSRETQGQLKTKLKDHQFARIRAENKVEDFAKKMHDLVEKVKYLEEEKSTACDGERMAKENVELLLKEMEDMERKGRKKQKQLETEVNNHQCARIRAENRIGDFEKRVHVLEEKTTNLLKMESRRSCGKMKENVHIGGSENEGNDTRGIKTEAGCVANVANTVKGSFLTGLPSNNFPSQQLANIKKGEERVEHLTNLNVEGNIVKEPRSSQAAILTTSEVIDISDNEDENVNTPASPKNNGKAHVSTDVGNGSNPSRTVKPKPAKHAVSNDDIRKASSNITDKGKEHIAVTPTGVDRRSKKNLKRKLCPSIGNGTSVSKSLKKPERESDIVKFIFNDSD